MLDGLYRSRTDMPLRAVDFESTASANFAKRPSGPEFPENCSIFRGIRVAFGHFTGCTFASPDSAKLCRISGRFEAGAGSIGDAAGLGAALDYLD